MSLQLMTKVRTRTGMLVIVIVMLGTAIVLVPHVTQAATPPIMRQSESPLATPAPADEASETSASTSASTGTSSSAVGSQVFTRVESSQPRSDQPMSVTITGDADAASLRSFVGYMLGGYGTAGSRITVTVGAEPLEWPVALTLPEGAEAVGGFVRRGEYEENVLFVQGSDLVDTAAPEPATNDDEQADVAVVEDVAEEFDAGSQSLQLLDAMRQSLLDEGYVAPPNDLYDGTAVFLPSATGIPDLLCDPAGEYIVSLGAVAVVGEPPAVRLSLSPEQNSDLCSGQSRRPESALLAMLPRLTPPDKAEVTPRGTGMGGNQVEVDARIITELTAAELAEHYEAQLVDAGWENLGRAATDPIAWSSWTFDANEGETWTGTFTIVQQGGDATHFGASLAAERAP